MYTRQKSVATAVSSRRASRQSLRLANTTVRLFRQTVELLSKDDDDARRLALARLRRYFRLRARWVAREGSSIEELLTSIRQAYQTAQHDHLAESFTRVGEGVLLEAIEATVQGFVKGHPQNEEIDQRVRDDALSLLEEERRRLARELHDETGQILTAVLFKIDLCLTTLPTDAGTVASQLLDIRQTLTSATRDLHRLVYSLRPPMLNELGLAPTLRWLLRQFESQYGIETTLEVPDTCALPEAMETAIFRIVQEALTNVARHAQARLVKVQLVPTHRQVVVVVQDNGRGFDPKQVLKREAPRLGLLGMRERARHLGGRLVINSAPGGGTTLRAAFPIQGGVRG